MSLTSPPPRPRRELKIGDVVPLDKPKEKVLPSRRADDPARGPRGVFTNGRK